MSERTGFHTPREGDENGVSLDSSHTTATTMTSPCDIRDESGELVRRLAVC